MEFTNEIFFNKKLTSNETIIITYCGKLYSEHSEHISIVYGYGDNWDETSEAPMKEIENGFEVTLEIKDYNTFNFCFKNNFNIWDNNFGFNYISPISPKEIPEVNETLDSTLTKVEEQTNQSVETSEENPIIESTENTINDTQVENSNEETSSNVENEADKTSEVENETSVSEEEKSQAEGEENKIESLFSNLLDSILDNVPNKNETINPEELNGFGLQSVDEIKEENLDSQEEIFKEFYEELATVPTPEITNLITEEFTEESSNIVEVDEPVIEPICDYEKYDKKELDSLMDNILNSITSENNSNIELSSPIEKIENKSEETAQESESIGLPAIKSSTSKFENFIDNSYKFIKKFGNACKKIGSLLKLKAQEYGIIKER
jgi:hypothetical protein